MSITPSDVDVDTTPPSQPWFERPLSRWWCALGWCVATAAFLGLVVALGGTAVGDAYESIYATWAVAHGHLSCMYPPHVKTITTFAAPVYPLVSGGLGAIARIGHGVPFPSGSALGHLCASAVPAMIHWAVHSGAVWPTLRTGYVGWLFLMAGLVWLLRASGRGRCAWEPITLLIVACLPPVWMSVEMYFHPQDLFALGFALAAMACALRNQWIAAGILVALAVLSQQYAVLVAVPLLVVAPAEQRLRYVVSAIAVAALVAVPLLALTSGQATRYLFFGSGAAAGIGGTLLWELHVVQGASFVVISRILPVVLSALIAWLVTRRMGQAVLQPAVLISLVAVSLSLRLVFEENLFGYYYMALAVLLVVLDVVRGRLRESLVAWLAMVTLVYSEGYRSLIVWRVSWGQDARHWIPAVVIIGALLLIVRHVLRHQISWDLLWLAAAALCALIVWPVSSDPLRHQPVTWLWQLVLVAMGIVLAGGPLRDLMQQRSAERTADRIELVTSPV